MPLQRTQVETPSPTAAAAPTLRPRLLRLMVLQRGEDGLGLGHMQRAEQRHARRFALLDFIWVDQPGFAQQHHKERCGLSERRTAVKHKRKAVLMRVERTARCSERSRKRSGKAVKNQGKGVTRTSRVDRPGGGRAGRGVILAGRGAPQSMQVGLLDQHRPVRPARRRRRRGQLRSPQRFISKRPAEKITQSAS